MSPDERYILRCLQLAALGAGQVSPNPLVGAVIVLNNQIIGEGWHQYYGGNHAEVNAINRVTDQSQLKLATLYCSLEPCHHFGKTPPCVDLIIHHQFKRVVICNIDPNPLVAGQSVKKMRDAGIEVKLGVLEQEGKWLNRSFFHWITNKKTFVILKWAQSSDGFLSKLNQRTPISSPTTRRLVHQWRSTCDGIIVGTQTAAIDDPMLDDRLFPAGRPTRITFDFDGRLPTSNHLLDDSMKTIIFGPKRKGNWQHTNFLELERTYDPEMVLQILKEHQIQQLLVEGGAKLLQSFIDTGNWHEIRRISNGRSINSGVLAPTIPIQAMLELENRIGDDRIQYFKNNSSSY